MPSQTWPFSFEKATGIYEQRKTFVAGSPIVLFFKLTRGDNDDHFTTKALLKNRDGNWEGADVGRGEPPVYVAGYGLIYVATYSGERIEDGPVRPGKRDGTVHAIWRPDNFPERIPV